MASRGPIEYFLITIGDEYDKEVLKKQVAAKFVIDQDSVTDNSVNILMSYLISVKWMIFRTISDTIPVQFFQHNRKIQYLYIRADNVTSLPSDLFEGLKQLKSLSLHTRHLEVIPNEIRFRNSIRHLSIEALIRDEIHIKKSMNLGQLKSFKIVNSCGVRPYPILDLNIFRCSPHLLDMELSCVTLTHIFFPPIKKINLTKLSIYDSDFSSVAFFEMFHNMPNLKYLVFEKCSSLCFSNGLDNEVSALKYLYFMKCHLRSVPVGFLKSCKQLQVLSLRGNDITVISDNTFSNNRQLVALDLSENSISKIEKESFKNLKKLVALNLEMNDLNDDDNVLTDAFVHLKNLEYLNLYHNPLVGLSLSVFTHNSICKEGYTFDDKGGIHFMIVRPKSFDDKTVRWFKNKVNHTELYFNYCFSE